MPLRFIHLSDIHFSNRAARLGFDPDRDLRNELRRDIQLRVAERGPATAVLVSGDIAYAGKRPEYEDAAAWLAQVCAAAQCSPDAVFVCPGNHDIDQDVLRANAMIQDAHDAIRRESTAYDRDAALIRRLQQPEVRNVLYAPMREYNDFAARFGCDFFGDADSFVVEHDFELNDGSTLRLHAMNTALLSGLSDARQALFLGSRAWTLPRHDGVEYMAMAHHPPSWLLDEKDSGDALDARAAIQLFGHEHDQRVMPGRDWIKLYAGSVNPHRAEPNWKPGYNIIEVQIEKGEAGRILRVDVLVREWQPRPPQFRALEDRDNRPVFSCPIPVQSWHPTTPARAAPEMTPTPSVDSPPPKSLEVRQLVFRFFKLGFFEKTEIVSHLRVLDEEDKKLPELERFKLALTRAQQANRLAELDGLIRAREEAGGGSIHSAGTKV